MWSVPRRLRGSWKVCPRARRAGSARFRPGLLPLEPRQLLSTATADPFAPTDAEQYMLELLNRARANPVAEGQRLLALAQTDPVLRVATQGWDLSKFVQVISSYGAEPPLAFNTRLNEAALDHSKAMLAANVQFHTPSGYLTNSAIAKAYDGQAYYPTGNSWWATGENVFAYSQNVNASSVADYANYFEAAFLIDWGNTDFGHLTNVLAPGPGSWSPGAPHYPYSEIGIGLLNGVTPTVPPGNSLVSANQGLNVGPSIVSEEFGWRSGNPILTGSFYLDKDNNGFYSPGEGYGGVTITAVGRNGQGTFQTQTWASGGYSLPLPPGTYTVTASGVLPSPVSTTVTLGKDNVLWEKGFKTILADQPVPADYNGDHKTDLAVVRPATGEWFVGGQANSTPSSELPNDVPLAGDFDGVGHAEQAFYRPSTGQWFVNGPSGWRVLAVLGGSSSDVAVPGDYDGVGHTEVAIYRASTAQWFVIGPNGQRVLGTFGAPNLDIPIPGDYDGVGHSELAVYRPLTGEWFVLGANGSKRLASFGEAGVDIPVPGDYDGVGHLEEAVYRPTTGQWFILGTSGTRVVKIGSPNLDVPVRGDFNGDGKADPAVYRPSTAQCFVNLSGGGTISRQFGQPGNSSPASTWISRYLAHPSSQVTAMVAIPSGDTAGSGQKPTRREHVVAPMTKRDTAPRQETPRNQSLSSTRKFRLPDLENLDR